MECGFLELLYGNISRHLKKSNDLNANNNAMVLCMNEAGIYSNTFLDI